MLTNFSVIVSSGCVLPELTMTDLKIMEKLAIKYFQVLANLALSKRMGLTLTEVLAVREFSIFTNFSVITSSNYSYNCCSSCSCCSSCVCVRGFSSSIRCTVLLIQPSLYVVSVVVVAVVIKAYIGYV